MKKLSSRRGSALLIVLGMLAFMVVSAVGFAVYMRQSRVPSSHLRREATARYLLKSALANAVSRINGEYNAAVGRVEGVGDDPYPGVLVSNTGPGLFDRDNGDYWLQRVFMPFGQVSPAETVSTLTLEALAYLPPAIINEVRVYSRKTRTAQWTNLAYDLGRYAFCAVDVSDCFDINKLSKVKRRTSSPGERIALTSLFPDDAENLAADFRSKAGNIPFVSLADFNVAFGNSPYTPFVRYLKGGNNGQLYLANDADSVSNALFITDTWFPATNAYLTTDLELKRNLQNNNNYFDLSTERGQPFRKGDYGAGSFLELNEGCGDFGKQLISNFGIVGMTCLYDYLDKDQVPLSLAMPTVETAPMVCSVNLAGNLNFKFELEKDNNNSYVWSKTTGEGKEKVVHQIERTTQVMTFKGIDADQLVINGTAMYPFKRMKADKRPSTTYKVEALLGVFFAQGDLKSRLENEKFRPTLNEWQNGGVRDGIVFYKTQTQSLTFGSDIEKTDDALKDFLCKVDLSQQVSLPVYYHIQEKDSSSDPLPKGELEDDVLTLDGTYEDKAKYFALFDEKGEIALEFSNSRDQGYKKLATQADREGNSAGTKQRAISGLNGKYHPTLALWVRITDGTDAVDLVPAVLEDDAIHLGVDMPETSKLKMVAGGGVPILDMQDAREFKHEASMVQLFNDTPFTPVGWNSFFAVDPRYNFAPEDWFGKMSANAKKEAWKDAVGIGNDGSGGSVFGTDGRDRDIFMFTSDQETLQSVCELQFLPYVQRLGQNVTALSGDYINGYSGRYNGNNNFGSRSATSFGSFANGERFWRTYSCYGRNSGGASYDDPCCDLRSNDNKKPITVVNGAGDFRVNPFSPDDRVIGAALFDTPWDYYVASTNKECNKVMSAAQGTPEAYAFGTESDLTSDRWEESVIGSLARHLRNRMREEKRADWEEAFEDLDWDESGTGDHQTRLWGVDLGSNHPLHGVDRKFLFSFWRECFQNRQQLFLIFIRAEPLTVGGAGGDSLSSSQLGARGVALVWRDPMPPPRKSSGKTDRGDIQTRESWRSYSESHAPHRTRVLFYHQFD